MVNYFLYATKQALSVDYNSSIIVMRTRYIKLKDRKKHNRDMILPLWYTFEQYYFLLIVITTRSKFLTLKFLLVCKIILEIYKNNQKKRKRSTRNYIQKR